AAVLVRHPPHFCSALHIGDGDAPLDLLADVARACPEVPALVLVRRGDVATTVRAIRSGAADCIEMPVTAARLLLAIDSLDTQTVHRRAGLHANLTRTERVVLHHVLNGLTSQQIGKMLCRSPRTIHVHRRNIMAKLGAASIIELVKLEHAG
ncbi:MAG TPA: LuxR C-terminal-related transcriptional regulator, partial [Sedimentisphaerales bacterium]|nr:LuxR C-terminal-related transcriptional regulator [Sedimentisphaerales bacterium]